MDIIFIVVTLFLSFRNGLKAKMKGLQGITWGAITFGLSLVTYIVGVFFVVLAFCRDVVDLDALATATQDARKLAAMALAQALFNNPLHIITIELFGFGGYLLVHYMLDHKPDRKKPEMQLAEGAEERHEDVN